jgi:CheY-like chemotaxis protein
MKKPIVCLLIDDDFEDQEIFMMALQNIDHPVKCITENDAINALGVLRSGTIEPDFIFVDVNLPRMDGREFIREVRKMECFDDVKVIAYSSSSHEKEHLLRVGASHFFPKQISIPLLEKALSELFCAECTGQFEGAATIVSRSMLPG